MMKAYRVLLPVLALLCAVPCAGQLVINEIDYDQVGTDGAEFVELKNTSGGVINLDNYTLQLVNGNAGGAAVYDTIDLPNVNLAPGDYYVICANAATVPNCDLDDGPNTDFIQNGSPDAVGLRDMSGGPPGVLVDAVSYEGNSGAPYTETAGVPLAAADSNTIAFIGLSRFPDGTDTNNNSADLSLRCITPGAANASASSSCPNPIPAILMVNEVDYDQGGADTSEFVEIKNTSTSPVDLDTFELRLVDGTGTVYQTIDLPSFMLPGGGYYVVCANPATVTVCNLDVLPDTDLIQDGAPDAVALAAGGAVADVVSYEGNTAAPYVEGSGVGLVDDGALAFSGISRFPDGADTGANAVDFSPRCITPGFANTAANSGCTLPVPPILVVNEIDYDQAGTDAAEFLEIRNNGASAVNLDPVVVELVNGSGTTVYQAIDLPNFSLAAGAYFVVCANNTTTPNCNLDVTPETNLIQNGAPDAVALRWNGILVDTVSYEGNTGAPYTETSGSGLEDDGGDDFVGISRFPDGGDTGVNNADLSARCITPGAANVATTAPCPPPAILGLAIDDVAVAEGQAGTRIFTFTVKLDQPAPGPGGVTFDIATADGTAQDDNPASEDNDYVAQTLTGQNIPAGNAEYTFDVTVNSDVVVEPDETFFVNVTNVTGTSVGDPQGLGTIQNDDFASITLIHDIQGPGASSPEDGNVHTVHGIVTGVKLNGFFVQEEEADYDADPATSEGIFVFTSIAPPAAAQVGNLVYVTGTVSEFVPSADLLQPPLTELTFATTVLDATGFPLPAAVPLTPTFPDPAGVFDQLERVEGMRVAVSSLTVSGPTLGNTDEPNATSTSTGVFFGVVTGVARPFREPGIQAPDPAPSGSIPPIPRFDSNPELLRVDSDGLTGAPILDVGSSAVVIGLVGPLDYTFRRYTILPDPPPSAPPVAAGGPTATAAAVPSGKELTVGSYNMERFFDTVNDPGIGEPVLTATAFDNRLNKASLGIRNHLRAPDILGVVEIENLSTLQALAARISADAVAASQPDPEYDAFLVEGNDVGGIDVGFLVKTAEVAAGVPRVTVNAVVQENAGELFVNADSSTVPLNDRPSLRLDAVVNHPNGASFPVTVIVNHLRSLNGVNSIEPGSSGWPTEGDRVRAKRQKQAESLANLVQARQTADPAERIILVGDFNAYEFNDGLVDSMNIIHGTPPPDNETAVPGDGVDLVNPDLDNLFDTPPAPERYSYIFDGQTQNIDHVVVNAALAAATLARRVEHPRINADFPAVDRNDPNTPRHLSDHDPIVGFFAVAAFTTADLSITKTDGVTTAVPGGSVTYTITASNAGPDPVTGGTVTDTFPAILTCTWTCVGAGGGTCTAAGSGNISDTVNLPVGGSVTYTASCTIAASALGTLDNTATVSGGAAGDPDTGNNSATDTDTLTPQADLAITKTDGVTTVDAGGSLTYTITASNAGPSDAPGGAIVADTFPAELTCTWTCAGAGGGVCNASGAGNISEGVFLPAGGSVTFTVSCTVSPAASGTISNTAMISMMGGGPTDPNPDNNSATDTDTLAAQADLAITKTDGVTTATAGGSVTYTITASNAGPSDASGATVTDTFPASLTCTWTCVGSGGGTCTAAGSGNISDTVNLPAGGSVTYTASCTISPSATGTLSNTATVAAPGGVSDPDPANNSATDTDTLGAQADLAITKTDGVTTATAGGSVTYTIVASNSGPSDAAGATVTDTFPASLTCTWTCVGAGGGTCTAAGSGNIGDTVNLPAGGSVTYTASCTISPAATGTLSNTATVAAPGGVTDPNPGNNSATDTNTLGAQADLAITKTDGVTTVTAGGSVTYTIVASNAGPSDATGATVADTFPASLTCTWTCVGAGGGTCTAAGSGNIGDTVNLPAGGSVTYTASCTISSSATGTLSNTATVTAPGGVTDPNPGNNSATDTDTVNPSAAATVSGTKSVSGAFTPGSTVTYTVVLNNSGPGTQGDNPGNEFTDVLPAGLTLVDATATSGTATATVVTNTVTWNGSIPAGGSVTITIHATITAPAGTTITNQGSIAYDADGNGINEAAAVTDDPAAGGATDPTSFQVGELPVPEGIPTLDTVGLALLALLLAMGGAWALRRRA
jgi:uncharacterized repeat protein (TIGR01451 family)